MNVLNKKIGRRYILILIVLTIIELSTGFFKAKINLLLSPPDSHIMKLRAFPEGYASICADETSPILLELTLYDAHQRPVPYAVIRAHGGELPLVIKPGLLITDKNGRIMLRIHPGFSPSEKETPAEISVFLSAAKSRLYTYTTHVSPRPVVLLHGFQDSSESMIPLKTHLKENGLAVYTVDYDTTHTMEEMAYALEKAISSITEDMKTKGIYTERTDIVAHSLGGLVARYYTTRQRYIENPTIGKIIFVNVPHHGTPWAEVGAKLLNLPSLVELHPTGELFTVIFPQAVNKGLNHTIQMANIALENDEVVPLPSASLNAWDIETKVYRIGTTPLSAELLMKNPAEAGSFHRQILFFVPVFDQILHFLTNPLPYPVQRKSSLLIHGAEMPDISRKIEIHPQTCG